MRLGVHFFFRFLKSSECSKIASYLFPFVLLCVAAALAPMSQLGVWCAATDSWLLGDGLGLPQGLALLYFALNTVAFSFILLCHTWMLWPLALYPYVQHAAQPEAETCQA